MTKRDRDPRGSDTSDAIRASSEFIGYGLSFAVSTLLFLLAGHWLDGKLGTDPLFALLGMFVGAAAGFWSLYVHVTGMNRPVRPTSNPDEDEDEPKA